MSIANCTERNREVIARLGSAQNSFSMNTCEGPARTQNICTSHDRGLVWPVGASGPSLSVKGAGKCFVIHLTSLRRQLHQLMEGHERPNAVNVQVTTAVGTKEAPIGTPPALGGSGMG